MIIGRADAVVAREEQMEHTFSSFADTAWEDPIALLMRRAPVALPLCKALRVEEFYSPNAKNVDAAHFTSRKLRRALTELPAEPEFEADRTFLTVCLAGNKGQGVWIVVSSGYDDAHKRVGRAEAIRAIEQKAESTYLFTGFADQALTDAIASFKVSVSLALPICKALGIEELYGPGVDDFTTVYVTFGHVLVALEEITGLEFEAERIFLSACVEGMKGEGAYIVVAFNRAADFNKEGCL
jgi:hypothetical protein